MFIIYIYIAIIIQYEQLITTYYFCKAVCEELVVYTKFNPIKVHPL